MLYRPWGKSPLISVNLISIFFPFQILHYKISF
jgi:hypothetical protein